LGSCVVTDGPVLNFTAAFNGREKKLGEILDQVSGDGNIKVRVQATSTEEFGLVEQVTICYYFKGMLESRKFAVELGKTEIVQEQLPAGSGYVRVEAETTNGAETFRCATNPIWIQASGPGVRQLAATFVD
jgi:hypothetical protein